MNREASVLRDKDKGENEVKTYRRKRKSCSLIKNLTAFAIAAGVFWVMALTSLAAEGEVTANANIRAQASTGSEVVASATKGKKIDILDAVKDSSGAVWYKVSVAGGGYGYIRSDMVKTSETITVSSTATLESPEQSSSSSSQPEATVPTAIEEQQAVIKCDSNARIRSGASTNHSVVTSLPNGTGVTLIGEANDSAGSKWYQIKCDYNGKVTGYRLQFMAKEMQASQKGKETGSLLKEKTRKAVRGKTRKGAKEKTRKRQNRSRNQRNPTEIMK